MNEALVGLLVKDLLAQRSSYRGFVRPGMGRLRLRKAMMRLRSASAPS